MGTDADRGTNASPTPGPPAADRRSFVRRAGLAAAGLTAAVPVLGASSASAAGTPAYTDEQNNFTADQEFSGKVGIGAGPNPNYPLYVKRADIGAACRIDAKTQALVVRQTDDHEGAEYDTMNVFHRGTGDAVYVDHKGGKPPGYTGPTGGNAGLNVLVPYNLDATGTGREGSVRNDRTGMKAIFVQTMPTNDDVIALDVAHWSNSYAAIFTIQPPGYPQGTGGGIKIEDYSTSSSLKIGKWGAPRSGEAIIALSSLGSTPVNALRVSDNTGAVRALISSDGTMSLGTGNPFAVRLQVEMPATGVARNLALTNPSGAAGAGAQIEFDDRTSQQALIAATFDSLSPRNSSLRFSVRSSDAMAERLRLSGAGIGFFGASPVARPVVTGSRARNDALASLLTALANLGLVTDSTSRQ